MSSSSFEYVVSRSFGDKNPETAKLLRENLYEKFIEAENLHREKNQPGYDETLALTFERLRLGIGASLIQVFASLTEDPGSPKVVDLLLKALKAKSIEEIDKIMHDGVALFESLYSDVFINPSREKVLALFEKTLEADSRASINAILRDALGLLDEINLHGNNE